MWEQQPESNVSFSLAPKMRKHDEVLLQYSVDDWSKARGSRITANTLDKDVKSEWWECFQTMDDDRKGFLDMRKLQKVADVVWGPGKYTIEQLQSVIKAVDLNDDGIISWFDFRAYISKYAKIIEEEKETTNAAGVMSFYDFLKAYVRRRKLVTFMQGVQQPESTGGKGLGRTASRNLSRMTSKSSSYNDTKDQPSYNPWALSPLQQAAKSSGSQEDEEASAEQQLLRAVVDNSLPKPSLFSIKDIVSGDSKSKRASFTSSTFFEGQRAVSSARSARHKAMIADSKVRPATATGVLRSSHSASALSRPLPIVQSTRFTYSGSQNKDIKQSRSSPQSPLLSRFSAGRRKSDSTISQTVLSKHNHVESPFATSALAVNATPDVVREEKPIPKQSSLALTWSANKHFMFTEPDIRVFYKRPSSSGPHGSGSIGFHRSFNQGRTHKEALHAVTIS